MVLGQAPRPRLRAKLARRWFLSNRRMRAQPVFECGINPRLPALAGGFKGIHDFRRQADCGWKPWVLPWHCPRVGQVGGLGCVLACALQQTPLAWLDPPSAVMLLQRLASPDQEGSPLDESSNFSFSFNKNSGRRLSNLALA